MSVPHEKLQAAASRDSHALPHVLLRKLMCPAAIRQVFAAIFFLSLDVDIGVQAVLESSLSNGLCLAYLPIVFMESTANGNEPIVTNW
jgi:hypothetical protein